MTAYNNEQQGQAFNWTDTISQDAQEFILLPDGDYQFIVESFERGRFDGSEKMSACPTAILRLRIDTPQGPAYIRHQLMLHSKMEWRLSEFFASIGLKKKGQPFQMNWTLVPTRSGRCKVGRREYNGQTYNEVKQFYPSSDYESGSNGSGFVPGRF